MQQRGNFFDLDTFIFSLTTFVLFLYLLGSGSIGNKARFKYIYIKRSLEAPEYLVVALAFLTLRRSSREVFKNAPRLYLHVL